MLRKFDRSTMFATGTAALALVWGCSRGPTPITPPNIDADSAGEQAMELYDKNGDGYVGPDELDEAPSLKAAMKTTDADGDGKVTADEVTARIESWQRRRTGVTSTRVAVTMDGRPFDGATVTLDPEPFLGSEVKPGDAVVTDGVAYPSVPPENRPTPDWPPGVALGFYKVRISKVENGVEQAPARYNTATMLGVEIAPDNPDMMNNRIRFDLKSK